MARILALLVAGVLFVTPFTAAPANATPDHFTPRPGVTFNNPLASKPERRAIFHRIIRSVDSSPRGSKIQIFTWNFLTRDGADALIGAQRRGVQVHLLMDASNNTEIPNGPYRRLRATLREGNQKAYAKGHRSWARTCTHSCRGTGGAAHAKFFMFSQAGRAHRVVMEGSANFTLASTNNQWNDVVTFTGSKPVWRFYDRVFQQASLDRKARHPYVSRNFDGFRLMMFPTAGPKAPDPVMDLLNKIKCKGATNTASHRTRIRLAPDVIRLERGMRLAKKLRRLWNDGCDIHLGYTVVGYDIGKMLRSKSGRGPVPMKHLVQDYNGDGEFDNYFHLKAMTVVGNVGRDRSNYVTLNGSANWSGLARASDENLAVFWDKAKTLTYQKHLNYWYDNFPQSKGTMTTSGTAARPTTRVPTTGQLVFGSGPKAVYEDGTPYSRTGVDPYANLELD